jgi:hypothetical protein
MSIFGAIIVYFLAGYLFLLLLKGKFRSSDFNLAHGLLYYHFVISAVYYLYALANASDSKEYFRRTSTGNLSWFETYDTGTPFIDFLVYPFVNTFHFSYEACMGLFASFGYLAFLFFFLLFRQYIKGKVEFYSLNLFTVILFLPNMHFWSASLGKGSVIFLGIAMIFYALSKFKQRFILLILGFLIVYNVRPHIALVMLMSTVLGVLFSNKGISKFYKFLILAVAGVAFALVFNNVMQYVGVENSESTDERFGKLASDLKNANSGIDISNYSLPEKIFAFLYRPLFVDSPNVLGIFSSVENLFYLLLTLKLFTKRGWQFIVKSDYISKTALFSFITTSIALAQITGNLGLAMRQKSQVMILFLFVILMYLNTEKIKRIALLKKQKALRQAKLAKLQAQKEQLNSLKPGLT